MPKVMELLTFQHPIKNPVDLNLRGFQCGGRGRNRTGVGGFAIHYFIYINQHLIRITIPQTLQIYSPVPQADEGLRFGVRNRFTPYQTDVPKIESEHFIGAVYLRCSERASTGRRCLRYQHHRLTASEISFACAMPLYAPFDSERVKGSQGLAMLLDLADRRS